MSEEFNFGPISVFCGASRHATTLEENAGHIESIENFGQILAKHKIPLVWGAGETGMMGAVSRANLDAGGEAIGVSTHHLLYGREGCQLGVTLLLVADDMQARKLAFSRLSCAFAIFPGGAGTADELYEYLLEREYGEHTKPLVVVNLGGYFDNLLADMQQAVKSGDIPETLADLVLEVDHEEKVLPALKEFFTKYPDQLAVPKGVTVDVVKQYFGDPIRIGPTSPEGAHTVTLSDTMIPLNFVGPEKLASSVALWCGGRDEGIQSPERQAFVEELKKLVHAMGEKRYRIIHSGQNSGMKGVVTQEIKQGKYSAVGVATGFMAKKGMVDQDQENLLVRRNQQSLDFTLKALSSAFVICPGGIDVREKLFEFLTEVDIQEHDKPLILWNYNGSFDALFVYLEGLFQRGYMNERALNKVHIVSTVDEIMALLEKKIQPPL